MTTQNWPNEIVSGWPLNPEQDGWHWLRDKESGCLYPCKWFTDIESNDGGFWDGCTKRIRPHIMALTDDYCGTCVTPTQINEMLAAERERCILACKNEGKAFESPEYSGGKSNAWGELFAVSECIEAIRNLGDAP